MVPGTGEPYPGGWGPYFVLSLDGRPLAHTAPHGGRLDWLPGAGLRRSGAGDSGGSGSMPRSASSACLDRRADRADDVDPGPALVLGGDHVPRARVGVSVRSSMSSTAAS